MVKRDLLVFVGDSNGCALVMFNIEQLMTAVDTPLRHARWRDKAPTSEDSSCVWPSNEGHHDEIKTSICILYVFESS